MNPSDKDAGAVLDWMKGTDLVEVSFRKGAGRFAFSKGGAAAPPAAEVRIPVSRRAPVPSPGVGFWHAAAPGQVSKLKKGARVASGAGLGWLEAGPDRREVKCPSAGTVVEVLVEEGAPVQYGQPLFVLEAE